MGLMGSVYTEWSHGWLSAYILLGLGLTLGFGILGIISFVHGELPEQNTHLALEVASRRGFSGGNPSLPP